MERSDDATPSSLRRLPGRLERASRYDFVLALIPLAFVAALGFGTLLPIPSRSALLGAATIGVAALLDALFMNPPGRAVTA